MDPVRETADALLNLLYDAEVTLTDRQRDVLDDAADVLLELLPVEGATVLPVH